MGDVSDEPEQPHGDEADTRRSRLRELRLLHLSSSVAAASEAEVWALGDPAVMLVLAYRCSIERFRHGELPPEAMVRIWSPLAEEVHSAVTARRPLLDPDEVERALVDDASVGFLEELGDQLDDEQKDPEFPGRRTDVETGQVAWESWARHQIG